MKQRATPTTTPAPAGDETTIPNSEAVLQVADAIRRIVRALRISARGAEAAAGMSGAQLFVLQKLSDGATLSLGDLAARTMTHQSSVSVVVTRLVDKRLVKRTRAHDDNRRVGICITAAGRRRLRGAPGMAQEQLLAALGALPSTDQQRLAHLLCQVVQAMGAGDSPAALFFEDDAETAEGGDPQ